MKMLKLKMQLKPTLNQVVRPNNKIMMAKMMLIWITITELAMVPEEQVLEEMLVPEDHPLHEMFDSIFSTCVIKADQ